MDKHQYSAKALSLVNDKQTYTSLVSDPTWKTERDLNQRLLLLKKSNKINEETRILTLSTILWFVEIHKPGISFCPIVSFVSSLTYNVSRYLVRILSPIDG